MTVHLRKGCLFPSSHQGQSGPPRPEEKDRRQAAEKVCFTGDSSLRPSPGAEERKWDPFPCPHTRADWTAELGPCTG